MTTTPSITMPLSRCASLLTFVLLSTLGCDLESDTCKSDRDCPRTQYCAIPMCVDYPATDDAGVPVDGGQSRIAPTTNDAGTKPDAGQTTQGRDAGTSPVPDAGGGVDTCAPGPLTCTTVGAQGPEGTCTGQPGVDLNVTGSGNGMWGQTDAFAFAYTQRSGDLDLIIDVQSIENTAPYAKIGLMVRSSLDPASPNVLINVTPEMGVWLTYRLTNGADSGAVQGSLTNNARWMRLVRTGDHFTSYEGADGVNWTLVGTIDVVMPAQVFVGVGTSSNNEGGVAASGKSGTLRLCQSGPGNPTPDAGVAPRDAGTQMPDAGRPVACGTNSTVCLDFENGVPAGWNGGVNVDTTRAHTGSKAMHLQFQAGATSAGQTIQAPSSAIPRNSKVIYTRMYVWMSTAMPTTHCDFMNLAGPPSNGAGQLVFYQQGVEGGGIMANSYQQGPNVHLSVVSCNGQCPMPKGRWVCLENMFDTGSNAPIKEFLDGNELPFSGGNQWPVLNTVSQFQLGFIVYGTAPSAFDMWIDDFAMSNTRIGCAL